MDNVNEKFPKRLPISKAHHKSIASRALDGEKPIYETGSEVIKAGLTALESIESDLADNRKKLKKGIKTKGKYPL